MWRSLTTLVLDLEVIRLRYRVGEQSLRRCYGNWSITVNTNCRSSTNSQMFHGNLDSRVDDGGTLPVVIKTAVNSQVPRLRVSPHPWSYWVVTICYLDLDPACDVRHVRRDKMYLWKTSDLVRRSHLWRVYVLKDYVGHTHKGFIDNSLSDRRN